MWETTTRDIRWLISDKNELQKWKKQIKKMQASIEIISIEFPDIALRKARA